MGYMMVNDEATEQEFLNDDKAIVLFTATWCGPCKAIKPLYQKLSNVNSDVKFYVVDVDEREEITKKFNIRSMPTFITLKNGKVINTCIGANIKLVENLVNELSL
jgi:thioredoxin 1